MASLMGGGAERQLVLLMRGLNRARVRPEVCLLAQEGAFLDQVPKDVPVFGLGKQSPADIPKLIVRLALVLRRHRPDVVYARVDYVNTLVSIAARLSGVPAPLILGEDSVQSKALQGMSAPVLRRELLRWSYGRAAKVVVPSPGAARDLQGHLAIRAETIEVIPNMIDVSAVQAGAKELVKHPFSDSRSPLIVVAGRLSPSKGQGDLIKAVAVLSASTPCNLLVLGDGADRERLIGLAADLGIAENVAFLGFVQNPFALMAQANVFVSPSHFESFGNVIIEAMAAGVPVVSTRVATGPEWLIKDRWNGLFAPSKDPKALADKIGWLLNHPNHGQAMARRALHEANEYDVAALIGRYEALFEQVGSGGHT